MNLYNPYLSVGYGDSMTHVGNLKEKPVMTGVGCTKFGSVLETPEIKGLAFHELVCEAAFEAMDEAGVDPKEIDAFYIGSMVSHISHMYSHHTQLADWLGLHLKPGLHFATACSTTNTGLGLASMGVASGKFRNVLVVGAEILSSTATDDPTIRKPLDPTTLWYWTDFGVDQAYGYHHSYDIATAYGGLPTLGYAKKYGVPMDKMDEAMHAVHKNVRTHSAANPKAFVQTTLEQEAKEAGFKDTLEFWKSNKNPFLAWPTRVRSVLNTVDGASAYIVSSEKEAKEYFKKEPIEVAGFHWSSSNYPWYGKDPTDWAIDNTAFQTALKMAKVKPEEIGYLDVHDCMQIYQLIQPEICGYFKKGEAWKAFLEGRTLYTGDKPMNTSGGRHGKGHAFAASAGASIYEAVKQMRGEATGRQIKEPPGVSVVHNHGYGMHTAVSVLKR
jgi:acetyl-CoA C-acetyltransferase